MNFLKAIRSLLLAVSVVAPWMLGVATGDAALGNWGSFGSYLLIVSFPRIPQQSAYVALLLAALIISSFAALGANVALGSVLFFIVAVLAAIIQGLTELKCGMMRLPAALGVLAFFLTTGQIQADEMMPSVGAFLGGTLWGVIALLMISERTGGNLGRFFVPKLNRHEFRFITGISLAALAGGALGSGIQASHSCWLPAASLRILKPTRQQTLTRMRDRGVGTLLGAGAGGALLGLYTTPWLHIALVLLLVFTMLMFGAKRYAIWTFCLTAVALTFNLHPGSSPWILAFERGLLTILGLGIVVAILLILPKKISDSTTGV